MDTHRATRKRRPVKRSAWSWLKRPETMRLAIQLLRVFASLARWWGE